MRPQRRRWTPPSRTRWNEAVLEEYGALNLYNAVLEQYPARSRSAASSGLSSNTSTCCCASPDRYGVDEPANPGLTVTPTFATLQDACAAGVAAEIADAALYDELLVVTENPDVVRVYENLQAASLNSHLPAFEACD